MPIIQLTGIAGRKDLPYGAVVDERRRQHFRLADKMIKHRVSPTEKD
jgi:hypothetical protein